MAEQLFKVHVSELPPSQNAPRPNFPEWQPYLILPVLNREAPNVPHSQIYLCANGGRWGLPFDSIADGKNQIDAFEKFCLGLPGHHKDLKLHIMFLRGQLNAQPCLKRKPKDSAVALEYTDADVDAFVEHLGDVTPFSDPLG